jgi:tetratricopeptide (TPR) repeat protein
LSCLYGVFIFYEGLLVPTTLILFLDLIAIILLINDNLTKGRVFIAGLFVGLGSLCQGSNILFGLSLFIWFLIIFKFNLRKVIVHSALFYAAMLAVILPVTVRNFLVGGDLVPITAHDGINFYIGNNPDATGTFNPPDGMSSDAEGLLMDSRRMAEEARREKLKPSQVSRFWYSKGLEFIRKEPVKYLSLLFRKALIFLNGKEVSDVEDFEFHRMFFPQVYKTAFLDFRIIGPLGLLGLGLSFRHRRKEFVPLWLFLISFMASSVLFFVNSRYRFPVVPVFILFAGYALWWGRDAVKEKRFKDLFIGILILLCLSVLMNLRLFTQNFATSYYGLGVYYTEKGDHDKAMKEYEKVLKLEPQMPGVHNNIGNIYYEKGNREGAIKEYKEEIRLFPGHAKRAYYNLGTIYLESGKYEEAKRYLSGALKIDPDYKEAKDALKKASIY